MSFGGRIGLFDQIQTIIPDSQKCINKPVGFYGSIAPPGPNVPSSECPPNVMPNSQFRTCPDPEFPSAPFRIYEHAQCQVFEVPLCSAPMSYLAGSKWGRPLCYGHAAARWCLQRGRGCLVRTCVMAIGADLKMYLLRHFCSNRV